MRLGRVLSGVLESAARETAKRRTVYAPRPERDTNPPAVISVTLDEDEDVEWIWTHTSGGKSVVTGYTVTKRADECRERTESSWSKRR